MFSRSLNTVEIEARLAALFQVLWELYKCKLRLVDKGKRFSHIYHELADAKTEKSASYGNFRLQKLLDTAKQLFVQSRVFNKHRLVVSYGIQKIYEQPLTKDEGGIKRGIRILTSLHDWQIVGVQRPVQSNVRRSWMVFRTVVKIAKPVRFREPSSCLRHSTNILRSTCSFKACKWSQWNVRG